MSELLEPEGGRSEMQKQEVPGPRDVAVESLGQGI